MRLLGNVLWVICGGLLSAICFALAGFLLCITIIGIPFGVQCFKVCELSLAPFGKKVTYDSGFSATLGNILWIILFGWELTLAHLALALFFCITIIGIPFGKQFFKLAAISFLPFGATIETKHVF